jgi:flavin reductase (DIM6/NTAB) family NADH-FMN oxidoreductase RutF
MDAGDFDAVTGRLDYPMYVLTVPAIADGRPAGCLVGFATQCSIDPVAFLVCVSKRNHTFRAISGASMVGVHVLRETDRDMAVLFGTETGDRVDKFAQCRWTSGYAGVPVLEDCLAWFVGSIEHSVDLGDHVGFQVRPVQVSDSAEGRPLMLASVLDLDPGHHA